MAILPLLKLYDARSELCCYEDPPPSYEEVNGAFWLLETKLPRVLPPLAASTPFGSSKQKPWSALPNSMKR